MTLLLHRLAALYLRLRGKRPPLEDLISAWSGGRWDPRIYETATLDGLVVQEGRSRADQEESA